MYQTEPFWTSLAFFTSNFIYIVLPDPSSTWWKIQVHVNTHMTELLLTIQMVVLSEFQKKSFLYTTSQNRIYSWVPNVPSEQKQMDSTPMFIAALITKAKR